MTGPISVTTPAGTATSAASFEVKPRIDSFSQTSGLVGAKVTISGSGFTGTISVTFAGTPAAFVLVNDFTIKATVPAGANDGKIKVTTSVAFADSGSKFNVINPKVRGESRTGGPRG